MRVGAQSIYSRLLAGLALQKQRTEQGLDRLAGGKDVRVASEDPSGHNTAMGLRARLVRIQGYDRAASTAQANLSTIDSVLGEGVLALTKAKTLAMAAGSFPTDAANEIRAVEVEALRDQLLLQANTQQDGRYLFSGTATTTTSFDATGAYAGNLDEMQAPLDVNDQVGGTLSGQAVFLDGVDLFTTLGDLAQALRDNDATQIAAAIPDLDTGIKHLSQVRGDVGVRLQGIDQSLNRHADETIQLVQRVSDIEDTDIAEVIVGLEASETTSSALSAAASRFLGRSLFDYLG